MPCRVSLNSVSRTFFTSLWWGLRTASKTPLRLMAPSIVVATRERLVLLLLLPFFVLLEEWREGRCLRCCLLLDCPVP